jgi:broad specificity phosphatase PhoE
MKKRKNSILAFLLCVVMIFTLVGCSGKGAQTANENAAETTKAPETENAAEETKPSDAAAEAGKSEGGGNVHLYFMRHGKTILNTLDRVQGWCDSPLTDAGVQVAKNAAAGLADIKFDYAYSSDRLRAIETANIVLEANKATGPMEVIPVVGLREINFGKYEGELNGVMWGDVMEKLGLSNMEEFGKFMVAEEDATDKAFDTIAELDETGLAETSAECRERLMDSIDTIVKEVSAQGGGNVLIVGHGAAIVNILSNLSGEYVGELENASISEVEYANGEFKILSAGDTSYAEKGAKIRGEVSDEVVIYLTRHGKTLFNTMDRVQGWTDSPLTEAGVEVAEKLGGGLSDVKFASVYTSDLGRAVETADIVMKKNTASGDVPHTRLKKLREANYGSFEGGYNNDMAQAGADYLKMTVGELFSQPNALEVFYSALVEIDKSGDAESYGALCQRTYDALLTIAEESLNNGGGNVLVVSHGNAIMSILHQLGENAGEIANASVTKIIYKDGGFTVESINDTGYIGK